MKAGPAVRSFALCFGLVVCGACAAAAWRQGLWGTLSGALLVGVWTAVLVWRSIAKTAADADVVADLASEATEAPAYRLLLDAAPTPMLAVEEEGARAINRAARRLFGTDDRILPVPAGLLQSEVGHLRHEGRSWRIDRVMLGDGGGRMVIALIDIEREERAAEARAAADLIQVLGHELMNGLAPMASLAESGLDAIDADPVDTALLRDILGTLARHSEGLQRFAEAYRALARLPDPQSRPVRLGDLLEDLARLFEGRWPDVTLAIEPGADAICLLDRDQISQALWAVLQNAAEAAAAGAGHPRVGVTVRAAKAQVVVDIEDNGEGIPADSAALVFRPFYTTKTGGTGIGLSLARQIALAHGGMLSVVSRSPATFRMVLPRRDG